MIRGAVIGIVMLMVLGSGLSAETFTRDPDGVFVGSEFEETFDIAPGEKLIINSAASLSGAITISAGAPSARLVYRKRLKTGSKAEAAEFAEAITVDIDDDAEGPVISLRAPSAAPWSGTGNSGRLEGEIFLPDGCALQINTAYFDIEAAGPFSVLTITESLSKIHVENVLEATDIKVSNRSLSAANLRGRLSVSNKYGRIKLENIDTGGETGTVRNEHGEIIIDTYRGSLDARTSYDRLSAQKLYLAGAKNRIKNVSGPIYIEFDSLTTGKFRINNQYGDISVSVVGRLDARFICKNDETGRIVVEDMTVEPTLIYDNRLEFTAAGGEGKEPPPGPEDESAPEADTTDESAEVRITAKDAGEIIINGPDADHSAGGR